LSEPLPFAFLASRFSLSVLLAAFLFLAPALSLLAMASSLVRSADGPTLTTSVCRFNFPGHAVDLLLKMPSATVEVEPGVWRVSFRLRIQELAIDDWSRAAQVLSDARTIRAVPLVGSIRV
jgi:hypothetical protein